MFRFIIPNVICVTGTRIVLLYCESFSSRGRMGRWRPPFKHMHVFCCWLNLIYHKLLCETHHDEWKLLCFVFLLWFDQIWMVDWQLWRHQMETFSALLAVCAGNSPVTGEFPSKARDAEFWCFLWFAPEQTVEKTTVKLVILDAFVPIMTSL